MTLYVTTREEWRTWLVKNHRTAKEVWLVYYKRHTGKPRIAYDDAVEEALCFGWIDSIVKRIDDEKYVQKFTPRRSGSKWSKANIERARKMIRQHRMTRAGLVLFRESAKTVITAKKRFATPPDFRKALAQDATAFKNYENFAPGYRKTYIRWIEAAKRRETREKRIGRVVQWARQNKKPGML
jgi:uncharacterized protein YdeI (YjbR/CyaY-like superfamily)